MKSRDLLLLRIEQFLRPMMEERGFSFARSKIYFRRRFGDFSHLVRFFGSHLNGDDYCSFQTGWEIRSSIYRKWFREAWGEDPPSGDWVWARIDNGIPGWLACHAPAPPRRLKKLPLAHRIENKREDSETMLMLQNAFANVGIPYLERMSSWEAIAEDYMEYPTYSGYVCDLYMIAGKKAKARRFVDEQIRLLRSSDEPNDIRALHELEIRKEKYFEACQVFDFRRRTRVEMTPTT